MLVLLEGNIAAGKSTLGQRIAVSEHFNFITEPVARWQDSFAANLLERFYTDTRRWAFTLQIGAFVTRAQTLQEAPAANSQFNVFERSIYCDRHVFAKNLHKQGFMDDTEWALYLNFWNYFKTQVPSPDAIIYLKTPAKECHRRLQIRGRAEEQNITLEYLQQLEDHHDEWLLSPATAKYPVIELDGNQLWTPAEIRQRLMQLVSA